MKTLEIAYCLVRKNSRNQNYPERFSPLTIDSRLPIYWLKNVAEEESMKFNCDIIKVVIEPVDNFLHNTK